MLLSSLSHILKNEFQVQYSYTMNENTVVLSKLSTFCDVHAIDMETGHLPHAVSNFVIN